MSTVFVSNCSPGELTIRAPQCEVAKIVAYFESLGVTVERPPTPPAQPLGIPTYNWGSVGQSEFARAVARSAKKPSDGKPTPIPQTNWQFGSQTASKPELVLN